MLVSRHLRVLHIASECAPFAKTGGLGDVVGSLPIAQRERGMDVRVVLPLYKGIDWDNQKQLPHTLVVPMGGFTAYGGVRRGYLPASDVPIYFLEHNVYFDRSGIYGTSNGDYGDNVERFAFLCRGAIQLARAEQFQPDIIHAHDWQAALSVVYTNTTEWGTPMHQCGTVLTIHNLGYQGMYSPRDLAVTGLGPEHFNENEFEHFGALNLLKAGLMHTNRIVAVSPTYAREIMGHDKGAGLDGVIRSRGHVLSGVLNGIDSRIWNPETDPKIASRYSEDDLSGKAICKAAIQRQAGLPERANVPLFGIVSRLTGQKGLDLLVSILPRLLDLDLQIVVLGSGDPQLERAFATAARMRPDKIAAALEFNDTLAHKIEAGSDFFLMPSRYEPCGMNQLYSLRYGTLPIVHATGGLADTVRNYDERAGTGTGFVCYDLSPRSLFDVIGWAQWTYYNRPDHITRMRRAAMRQDYSWDRSAAEYEAVYYGALAERRHEAD